MRFGLVARADDRGLGHISWEVQRHLHPDRTLVIDMGQLARGFLQHWDRYPDGVRVPFDGVTLPEGPVREWLAGLDVVYLAETAYDWRLITWAEEAGCATVVHTMPEFFRHHPGSGLPTPTVWWAASPWRLEHLPPHTLVPVPIALDRWPQPPAEREPGMLRVLHTVGHRAMADRNGTNTVRQAIRMVRRPMAFTFTAQDGRMPTVRAPMRGTVVHRHTAQLDYWEPYLEQDLLVLPRRYGGCSLVVQEAMGAGLGLVLPSSDPHGWYPALPVTGRPHGEIECAAGRVPTWQTDPRALAKALDQLVDEPGMVAELQWLAHQRAARQSWDTLLPEWQAQLAVAADMRR